MHLYTPLTTRSHRRHALAVVWLLLVAARAAAQTDRVVEDVIFRHGAHEPIKGVITLIDAAGVTLRGATASDATTTLPWHIVRDIDSEKFGREWQSHRNTAEQLWRAVSRIQRNDPTLAETLLERMSERYRGQTHETALVVAEGLLRCRLARVANEGAVLPWLEAARLREAGVVTAAYDGLVPVIDASTLLCPQLPPAWPRSGRLERLAEDIAAFDAKNAPTTASLGKAYRQLALLHVGAAIEPTVATPLKHPGVEIVNELLSWRLREPGAPLELARIERRVETWPAWAQAWAHFHLGQTLLKEADRPQQDLGLVQLANVPARFRFAQPYLAGLALIDMADTLQQRGQDERAGALKRLVQERYPGHPASDAPSFIRIPELKATP